MKVKFDAHKECMDVYGTSLVSIHSKDEAFLLEGFVGYNRAWIGFVDFDINHMQNNKDGYGNGGNNNYNKCEWKWVDGSSIDYIYWRKDMYHSYSFEDCAYIDGIKGGGWHNADCDSLRISKYICSSPYWFINQKRKFELNFDVEADTPHGFVEAISIVTIGNDNDEKPLCIDALSINTLYNYVFNVSNDTEPGYYGYYGHHYPGIQHVVLEMTGNWIGGNAKTIPVPPSPVPSPSIPTPAGPPHLFAIIKYTVCKTEVVAMDIDYDSSMSEIQIAEILIPGSTCSNEQRLDDHHDLDHHHHHHHRHRFTYCVIDQYYPITRKTRYKISSKELDLFSFSALSKVTLYTGETITTTNDFKFDTRYFINFANVVNGTAILTNIKALILLPSDSWYDPEPTEWERSPPQIQHCYGKSYLPTSHILPWDANINRIKIEVDIKSHLRLTLCPFLETSNSKFVYQASISSHIFHFEPIGCFIHWKQPIYIQNTKNTAHCDQQQIIALNMNLDYLPICNSINTILYDGCQCNSKHCWCSDPFGNKINTLSMKIPNNVSWQQTCRFLLNC